MDDFNEVLENLFVGIAVLVFLFPLVYLLTKNDSK